MCSSVIYWLKFFCNCLFNWICGCEARPTCIRRKIRSIMIRICKYIPIQIKELFCNDRSYRQVSGNEEIGTDVDGPQYGFRIPETDIDYERRISQLELEEEQRKNEKLEHALAKAEEEKDAALRRLSEVMSQKLRDNNPNIVDLSDKFRPTKLGEMSNELYDNQWTSAFSDLETVVKPDIKDTERHIIKLLLDILMESYKYCRDTYQKEWQWLLVSVFGTERKQFTSEEIKQFKDLKKQFSTERLKEIQKGCFKHLKTQPLCDDPSFYNRKPFSEYVEECVRVGWLMQIQDPPVVYQYHGWLGILTAETIASANPLSSGANLQNPNNDSLIMFEDETGKLRFDKGLYREYTRSGPYIDFVVWPVMYLHENGPLLSKGVAQGCKA